MREPVGGGVAPPGSVLSRVSVHTAPGAGAFNDTRKKFNWCRNSPSTTTSSVGPCVTFDSGSTWWGRPGGQQRRRHPQGVRGDHVVVREAVHQQQRPGQRRRLPDRRATGRRPPAPVAGRRGTARASACRTAAGRSARRRRPPRGRRRGGAAPPWWPRCRRSSSRGSPTRPRSSPGHCSAAACRAVTWSSTGALSVSPCTVLLPPRAAPRACPGRRRPPPRSPPRRTTAPRTAPRLRARSHQLHAPGRRTGASSTGSEASPGSYQEGSSSAVRIAVLARLQPGHPRPDHRLGGQARAPSARPPSRSSRKRVAVLGARGEQQRAARPLPVCTPAPALSRTAPPAGS